MEQDAEVNGTNIEGTSMMHASILTEGPTYFYGQDAEFQAEVPKGQGCIEERSDGSVRIKDSAVMSAVIGGSNTMIDDRGTKTSIKIASPGESGYGQNVLLNTVVSSSNTKIDMTGANIKVKGKKKHKRSSGKHIQDAGVNIKNSAAVNVVAFSEGTQVITMGSEISIE